MVLEVARVDFRHDQRHVGLHAERGRVVDHHRARLLAGLGEFARAGRPGAEERVVDIRKRRRAQFLDRQLLARELDRLAQRARRGERLQVADRKFPLLQRAQNLLPHRAGGADDRNAIRIHGAV